MKNQVTDQTQEKRALRMPDEKMFNDSPFMQRLSQSSEENASLAKLHKVKQAFYSIEADILATEQAIMQKEGEITSIKNRETYDAVAIVNAKAELKGLYDGLEGLYDLRKEDFDV